MPWIRAGFGEQCNELLFKAAVMMIETEEPRSTTFSREGAAYSWLTYGMETSKVFV